MATSLLVLLLLAFKKFKNQTALLSKRIKMFVGYHIRVWFVKSGHQLPCTYYLEREDSEIISKLPHLS